MPAVADRLLAETVCQTGCEREEYLASAAAMLKRCSFNAVAALLQ